MSITVYSPEQQGTGAFDGGKIVEQKPIGFPGEGSAVNRVGPLFYWAWAESNQTALIPSHPHKAFEIVTYVIQGEVEHGDSLGTSQKVSQGGAQIIQAGSGVFHSEGMGEGQTEIFQIWFEPDIRKTIQHEPTYRQYDHEEFPLHESNGVRVKTVIGEGSLISLVTKPSVYDVEIEAGSSHSYRIKPGHALALVAIRGNGSIQQHGTQEDEQLLERDFSVITTEEESQVTWTAGKEAGLRIVFIEVPLEVDYPLYRK